MAQGYEVKLKYAREWFGVDLAQHQTKKVAFERLMHVLGKKITYRDLMDPLNEQHINEYAVTDGCIKVLSRLRDSDFRFHVVTSRNDHNMLYATQFVQTHFSNLIESISNTRNQSKANYIRRIGAKVHVDDDLFKLVELEDDILKVYFRQPENHHIPPKDAIQVHSFYDLERILMSKLL